MIHLLEDLAQDWRQLDDCIDALTRGIATLAREDAGCRRLMGIPGVGVIIASAIVAAVGTGVAFAKGRDFAAWLGLVPKQISTGNRYLRALFVGGAQALLQRPRHWRREENGHGFGRCLQAAGVRLHRNVWAASLPNKRARIAWGVLHHENGYDPEFTSRTVGACSDRRCFSDRVPAEVREKDGTGWMNGCPAHPKPGYKNGSKKPWF
jgi:transposase